MHRSANDFCAHEADRSSTPADCTTTLPSTHILYCSYHLSIVGFSRRSKRKEMDADCISWQIVSQLVSEHGTAVSADVELGGYDSSRAVKLTDNILRVHSSPRRLGQL